MEQEIQEAKSLYYSYKQYFSDYLPDLTKLGLKVVMALLVFVGGRKVIQWFVSFIKKSMERASVDKGVIQFTGSLLRIVLYILLVFSIATHFGVKESSIAALLGTAGVTVGLALQGGLANIAGGIMLLIFKPFQVGDYIIEGNSGKEGTVQAIGIMYTKLLSVDNKAIMIPNGNLSNASITNVTYQEKRRVDLNVSIEYSEDIKKVRKVLNALIEKEPARITDEPVKIYVNEFQASSIDIGIRYWVKTEDYWESRWRVLEEIKEEFDHNNIAIPFEQLDVNLIPQEKE